LVAGGRAPGFGVVLAGTDPASHIYLRHKIEACQDLGIHSETRTPPEEVTTEELIGIVEQWNDCAAIDGILVQLPLPRQVDSMRVSLAIAPGKDADGVHPCNAGKLMAGLPGPRACTPAGILELLKRYEIPIAGRRAVVVVGTSDIAGVPHGLAAIPQNTPRVTICHSKTARSGGRLPRSGHSGGGRRACGHDRGRLH